MMTEKMIIGENNPTFENLRSQLEILRKAQDALTTGRPLTKEENAEYSRLLNELEVRKHMTKEEYDALRDMTQSNEELAGALRTLVSNNGDADAKAIVAQKSIKNHRYDNKLCCIYICCGARPNRLCFYRRSYDYYHIFR